jgi:hypothetical protein
VGGELLGLEFSLGFVAATRAFPETHFARVARVLELIEAFPAAA